MRTFARRLVAALVIALPACRSEAEPGIAAGERDGPVVRVRASYPGANAQETGDTVVAPLLRQIHRVEGAVRMEAVARNDGTAEIVVRFAAGADPFQVRMLVLNRVALASPMLPLEVRGPPSVDGHDPDQFPPLWVAVRGRPNDDPRLLAHIARTAVTNAVTRVPGAASTRVIGPAGGLRGQLDPDLLAARSLSAEDVATALRLQNVQVEAGPAFTLTVTTSGRLADPDDLGRVVVKDLGAGRRVHLRDVARIEAAPPAEGFALLNGEAAALVAVTTNAGERVADGVRKAVAGVKELPAGVRAELFADVSADAPPVALVELRLPAETSREKTREVAGRATKLVRNLPGGPECLAFNDTHAIALTLLVKLPGGSGTPTDVRKALAAMPGVSCRVTDVSAGRTPFPVRIALTGEGHADLRRWADAVAKRVGAEEAAFDMGVWPRGDSTWVSTRIDREKAGKLGVRVGDIAALLHNPRGEAAMKPDELKKLTVRSATGKIIPVGALVDFETVTGPDAIAWVGLNTAVKLSANPPDGRTPAEAAAARVRIAEEERKRLDLPKGFRVIDLTRPGKPR